MNPTVKQQWTQALRSGAYAQGFSRLRQIIEDEQVTYCCLGVLCEVHRLSTGGADWRPTACHWIFAYDGAFEFLPDHVRAWAALDDTTRLVVADTVDEPIELALTYLNDERGLTFDQIAALIDAHL